MHVVGIDLSTKAIDLVKLAENTNEATWLRVDLETDGEGRAWDRVRLIAERMPKGSWWDDVYLVAIERPFSQSRHDAVRLAQGAVIACVPAHLDLWELAPQTWKANLGFKGRGKPTFEHFPSVHIEAHDGAPWPQDPIDALGTALCARDQNAAAVAKALGDAA